MEAQACWIRRTFAIVDFDTVTHSDYGAVSFTQAAFKGSWCCHEVLHCPCALVSEAVRHDCCIFIRVYIYMYTPINLNVFELLQTYIESND